MHLFEPPGPTRPCPEQPPTSTRELISRACDAIEAARALVRETATLCEECRLRRRRRALLRAGGGPAPGRP